MFLLTKITFKPFARWWLISSFAYLTFSGMSYAQTISVKGVVMDTVERKPLTGAVAMAVRLDDSLLVVYTRTNEKGYFKMDSIDAAAYQVIVSHHLFGEKVIIVPAMIENPEIDLQVFSLPPKSIELKEITVFGYADPVYFKGDTLVFTADSFRVKENAVVEDLLKKLPGVKVDGKGKIYVQGKAVDQVLVDGDEFFGGDPTIATRNLGASSIESVQVYEKKNENIESESSSEMLQVMNLKLKEEAKKGYFGKISAATDADRFYEGDLLFNRFSGKQKFSVYGLGSNTPHTSFDWNEINEYGLDGEYNRQTDDDGTTYYYSDGGQQSGIPKTYKAGFYYSDQLFKGNTFSLNYGFRKTSRDQYTEQATQYFLTDTAYNTNSLEQTDNTSSTHSINLNFSQEIDSLTDLELESSIKKGENGNQDIQGKSFYTTSNELQRSTKLLNSQTGENLNLTNRLSISRTFAKKERFLRVRFNYNVTSAETDGLQKSQDEYYFSGSTPDDTTDQKKTSLNEKVVGSAFVSYTEPITKKIKTEFVAEYSSNNSSQDKEALDFVNGEYSTVDSNLTSDFNNVRKTYRAGISLIYEVKKQSIKIGSWIRKVDDESSEQLTGRQLNQDISNILPYINWRYKFSDTRNLRISYSTRANLPDLNQMQPVVDNSDPNYLRIGNPFLKPSYSHRLDLSIYEYRPVSGRYLWGSLNFSSTNNGFGNSSYTDSLARTVSQVVNVDGNYNLYSYLSITLPYFSNKLELSPSGNYSYFNSNNYINGETNNTKNDNLGLGLGVTIRPIIDTIEFGGGINYTYSKSASSLNESSNSRYNTLNYSGWIEFQLPFHFRLNSSINFYDNNQRSQGYNLTYTIWNASLSRTFMKSKNLVVSLEANDILNQNIDSERIINNNSIVDTKSNVVGRYIMLRAVYKFNSNKNQEDESGY